jgi:uncharacterized protein YbjQ (UPF0145 family)
MIPLPGISRDFYIFFRFKSVYGMERKGGCMNNNEWITTAFTFEGHKILKNLGVVRGITVRSRSIVGSFGAGIQQIVGGNISIYTELCEQARQEAFDLMTKHALELGANAIIGMRYDANEISDGVAEVLAYGTAVVIDVESPK